MAMKDRIEQKYEMWGNFGLDLNKIRKIRDALTDEESRVLFDARVDYMLTGNFAA